MKLLRPFSREFRVCFLLSVLLVCTTITRLSAQQPPQRDAEQLMRLLLSPPENTFPEVIDAPRPDARVAKDRILELTETIANSRKALNESLNQATSQQVLPSPTIDPTTERSNMMQAIELELTSSDHQQSRRMDKLRAEIARMTERLERQRAVAEALSHLQKSPQAVSSPDTSPIRDEPDSGVPPIPTVIVDPPVTTPAVQQPTVTPPTPTETGPVTNADPTPTPITDAPVDRLALADNLFGAGKHKLALAIYSDVNPAAVSAHELAWVRYQIACCHRKLGDRAKAEEFYRKVAGDPHPAKLDEYARWWLKTLETNKDLLQKADRITSGVNPQ